MNAGNNRCSHGRIRDGLEKVHAKGQRISIGATRRTRDKGDIGYLASVGTVESRTEIGRQGRVEVSIGLERTRRHGGFVRCGRRLNRPLEEIGTTHVEIARGIAGTGFGLLSTNGQLIGTIGQTVSDGLFHCLLVTLRFHFSRLLATVGQHGGRGFITRKDDLVGNAH